MKIQALERLDRPISANRLGDPLGQFVSVGLHSICLALYLPRVHQIHIGLFFRFISIYF